MTDGNHYVKLPDERMFFFVHANQADILMELLADFGSRYVFFYAYTRGTFPVAAFLVLNEKGHFLHAYFPAKEGPVHIEQPLSRHIIVNGLGDVQQSVDLKLLEVEFPLQRLDA